MPSLLHRLASASSYASHCFKVSWKSTSSQKPTEIVVPLEQQLGITANDWAIVCPFNIGDVYLFAGFAHALRGFHGGDRVFFITKSAHAFIPRLFASVSEVHTLPEEVIKQTGFHFLAPLEINRGKLFRPNFYVLPMMGCKGGNFLDCIRGTLRIPWETKLELPREPEVEELKAAGDFLAKHSLREKRTVLLCPDANTTRDLAGDTPHFWESLAEKLSRSGYDVATNIGPKTTAVRGTIPLPVPLELFRAVSLMAGSLVANRSGLCDLVSDLPMKLVVIYPKIKWYDADFMEVTSLKSLGLSPSVTELLLDGNMDDLVARTAQSVLL